MNVIHNTSHIYHKLSSKAFTVHCQMKPSNMQRDTKQ